MECDEACRAWQEKEKRWREEAELREAENQRLQGAIDREQAEADQLEEQARLCQKRPSQAGCSPVTSSVAAAKPVPTKPAPPKPVSFVAAQQDRISRHGNPAGVGVRTVPDPDESGLEDAVDVPDLRQFALEADPTDGRGPRNLVWFSVVALAAIASLGYGLWRVLFVEGR
ncbi:MAG: hypothetical protein M3252_07260 [Actinomycetota bacterium]|nr:hypothetical protein [Actinomycetota bacterium]